MRVITNFFDRMVQRYLPDAFLFAVILTLIVFIMGIFFTDSSPIEMVEFWGSGFWDLLAFTTQMALIVVTGYVLANTPVVKTILIKVSNFANTPVQAVMLITFVASIASLINYGFGLVIGALLAIQIAKRVPSVDYRLLVAAGYSGFLLWHGGLSASIPLLIATPDHFLAETIGVVPVTDTIFSFSNIFIIIILLITLPFLNRWLLKSRSGVDLKDPITWESSVIEQDKVPNDPIITPSDKLENSRVISILTSLLGFSFIIYHFKNNGFDLNITIVHFILLILGILLHGPPKLFLYSVNHALTNLDGRIIHFPFYSVIMGMMLASGLSQTMSHWFVSISTEFTFPLFAFLSAGIVNFFVPSGGGQWAVQGPIMTEAGLAIGVDTAKTAIAVAW